MTNDKKRRRKRGKKMGEEFTPAYGTPSMTPPVEKEEAPAEVVEKPPAPEPKRMSDEDKVLTYLKDHGASSPSRVAKSLGMEWTAVMTALRKLRDEGKINLR